MIFSIAIGMLTNILSSVIYDVGKRGIERCTYSASKKELLDEIGANYKNSQYSQQEIRETLNSLLENQNLMFNILTNILSEFEMKTTINIYNNQIIFNVPASDVFKLQQINNGSNEVNSVLSSEKSCSLIEAIAKTPTEDEIITLINTLKEHIVVAIPTKQKSKMFEEWFDSKCGKKSVCFEINKSCYYSISRAEIYKEIPHEPRIFVVDTTDLYNYTYYEAVENRALSDGNNIVIKPNTNKGYIVAVSGTL